MGTSLIINNFHSYAPMPEPQRASSPELSTVAVASVVGPELLLGEFLDFAGVKGGIARAPYLHAFMNAEGTGNGIRDFPEDKQQLLLAFAKKKMRGEEPTESRRRFLKKGVVASAAYFGLIAADAADKINDGNYKALDADAAYAAIGVTSVIGIKRVEKDSS